MGQSFMAVNASAGRPQHHRIGRGLLAGILVGIVVLAMAAPAVQAGAVDCVVGPGGSQTATTVTGTNGDDTIDCGGASPGKTINGRGGNDTITGTAFRDTISGGGGNDTLTGGGPRGGPDRTPRQ